MPLSRRADFIDQANPRGAELCNVTIAFTVLSAVVVGLRVAIRTQRKILGFDDAWICLAFLFSVLLTITVVVSVQYGYGMNRGKLSVHQANQALFWWYLAQVFYKCITWPTKLSILSMYHRVFCANSQVKAYGMSLKYLIWASMLACACCFIGFQAAGIFACWPIGRNWDKTVPGNCIPSKPRYYAYVAFNFLTDIIILTLPLPLIKRLNIPRRQKIGLVGVFCLGSFVCIATIIRVNQLNTGSTDITYNGRDSVLWTCIEANIGIVCACLPLLRPLINWLIPWFAQRTHSGTHSSRRNTLVPQDTNRMARRPNRGWTGQSRKDTVMMSNITAADDVDTKSRSSSEVAITGGITRKVEMETFVESAEESDDGRDDEIRRHVQTSIGHAV